MICGEGKGKRIRGSSPRRFCRETDKPDREDTDMRLLLAVVLVSSPLWGQRRQTVWHPDHCDCVMVYEVNPSDPPGTPLRFVRAERVDPAHVGLAPEAAFNATLAENRTKNMALARLLANGQMGTA
jgi:hypothetical protein